MSGQQPLSKKVEMHTLLNVVLPAAPQPGLLPLYVDGEPAGPLVVGDLAEAEDGRSDDRQWTGQEAETLEVPVDAELAGGVTSRRSFAVPAGRTVSFATYFNAFPAGYWRRWCGIAHVELELELEGQGEAIVYRSDAEGNATRVGAATVESGGSVSLAVEVADDDGGWLWFDLVPGEAGLRLLHGRWCTDAEPARDGRASLAITTVNKAEYCVASLAQIAQDASLLELLDRVFVVDQGTSLLREEPGFDEVAADLGERLEVIEQPNLGGSGGFSRGMLESLRIGSEFVILLDDDVTLEPEGLARAIRFARFASRPVLVGGHMLDLNHPSVLHAYSELVDMGPFMWGAVPGTHARHDFARAQLRSSGWLHRRFDADFNGWWMCLIPREVLAEIGLSAPFFLKWDDAEYGLRASEAGYATVSLPGAALWHVSWLDKDDGIEWQAYFHQRNRVATALLHSTEPGGGWLVRDSRRQDLKHLLSMQYYTVALRHRALRDVLSGPERLHSLLGPRVRQARELVAEFPEAQRHAPQDVPAPVAGVIADGHPSDGWPHGWRLGAFALRYALRAALRPVPRSAQERPEAEMAPLYGSWWRLPRYDSVLVPTADRASRYWYRRDRRRFLRLLHDSIRLHLRLRREWDDLARGYREALPSVAGDAAWAQTFGVEGVERVTGKEAP